MILSGYLSFKLLEENLTVKKGRNNTTQLLFADMKYVSLFVDSGELLEYLQSMTEHKQQVNGDQKNRYEEK